MNIKPAAAKNSVNFKPNRNIKISKTKNQKLDLKSFGSIQGPFSSVKFDIPNEYKDKIDFSKNLQLVTNPSMTKKISKKFIKKNSEQNLIANNNSA